MTVESILHHLKIFYFTTLRDDPPRPDPPVAITFFGLLKILLFFKILYNRTDRQHW